jgi:hypothetical protein
MMKKYFRSHAPWLAILALTLLAAPAFAQVPQHMTFTGRLVDNLGNPLVGPVQFEFSIIDPDDPTFDFIEIHEGVPLDATGGFSVQLGTGEGVQSDIFDIFLEGFPDPLEPGVNRWLSVKVNGEQLLPLLRLGSVPWALIALQANKIVPWRTGDPNAPRFERCWNGTAPAGGTVADHRTGLQWENKTGTLGSKIDCETAGCPDPHDVNNIYGWSNTGTEPDGGAFTDFLARLNGEFDPEVATGCFAGRCDWRLPKISELQTILIGPDAAPGQATTCPAAPCIDPDYPAGSTGSSIYLSASTPSPGFVWAALFDRGFVTFGPNTTVSFVRGVRTGSCN